MLTALKTSPATTAAKAIIPAARCFASTSKAAAVPDQMPGLASSSTPSPSPTPSSFLSRKKAADKDAMSKVLDTVTERRARKFTADHFSQLGSTQNRTTTWQPRDSLHAPPSPLTLTQSHLVASGAHLGHSPTSTHRAYLPHVYGTRSGLSYIDLRQTLPSLRRAAMVVRGVVERDGIVVFVGSAKGTERAVWENAKRLGENGFGVTKWLPGSISNAKEVFGKIPMPTLATSSYKGPGEERKALPTNFKPSLLVLLSPTLNQHALREATANEIPTIGICDSDVDPRCVTYSIPANDDSPRAVELIAGVLGMAGKDGLERKKAAREDHAKLQKRRYDTESTARARGGY